MTAASMWVNQEARLCHPLPIRQRTIWEAWGKEQQVVLAPAVGPGKRLRGIHVVIHLRITQTVACRWNLIDRLEHMHLVAAGKPRASAP